jgi:hypothetical protein
LAQSAAIAALESAASASACAFSVSAFGPVGLVVRLGGVLLGRRGVPICLIGLVLGVFEVLLSGLEVLGRRSKLLRHVLVRGSDTRRGEGVDDGPMKQGESTEIANRDSAMRRSLRVAAIQREANPAPRSKIPSTARLSGG